MIFQSHPGHEIEYSLPIIRENQFEQVKFLTNGFHRKKVPNNK